MPRFLWSIWLDASADFKKGLAAYDRGDYATALRVWEPLAEQGDVDAQFSLGWMCEKGEGVEDDEAAMRWCAHAAKQGRADARHKLAVAAEQGNAAAQFLLGWMYEDGRGVIQDDQTAVQWYKRAAEQGYAPAQCELSVRHKWGHGVAKSDLYTHMWANIVAAQNNRACLRKQGSTAKDLRGWVTLYGSHLARAQKNGAGMYPKKI